MSNLCTVVDANDNVVGQKDRDEVKPGDIYRVAALWVINSGGQVLLAQRKWDKKNDPGKWSPGVAGTVEPGEDYDVTIVREAEEELGISGADLQKREKIIITDNGFGQSFYCQVYMAVLDWPVQQFTVQASEVEGIRWFDVSEIRAMIAKDPAQFTHGFAPAFEDMVAANLPDHHL